MRKRAVFFDLSTGRVGPTHDYDPAGTDVPATPAGHGRLEQDIPVAEERLAGAPDPGIPLYVLDGIPVFSAADLPATTRAAVEAEALTTAKTARIVRLWRETSRFVEAKSDGLPRYDAGFQVAAASCKSGYQLALLAGGLTSEQQAAINVRMALIGQVEAWIAAVWDGVYYPKKAELTVCQTVAEVQAVTWDLSPYEIGGAQGDPDVSLSQVRL